VSIVLMFAGIAMLGAAMLGAATLRRRHAAAPPRCGAGRLSGWPSRAPLLVLIGGLVTAPFYTIDKVVHFILLGLLWGRPGCTWRGRPSGN
jgi:hypothetical protein